MFDIMKNSGPNSCDLGHQTTGDVRPLPAGDGNIIVCFAHYLTEMRFRREAIAAIRAGMWIRAADMARTAAHQAREMKRTKGRTS